MRTPTKIVMAASSIVLLGTGDAAYAHPGHGISEQSGLFHWMFDHPFAIAAVGVVVAGALATAWIRRRE